MCDAVTLMIMVDAVLRPDSGRQLATGYRSADAFCCIGVIVHTGSYRSVDVFCYIGVIHTGSYRLSVF